MGNNCGRFQLWSVTYREVNSTLIHPVRMDFIICDNFIYTASRAFTLTITLLLKDDMGMFTFQPLHYQTLSCQSVSFLSSLYFIIIVCIILYYIIFLPYIIFYIDIFAFSPTNNPFLKQTLISFFSKQIAEHKNRVYQKTKQT